MSEGGTAEEVPSITAIATVFSGIAMRSFGGGLAAWTQKVMVDERRWLSGEEYLSASTICGILPGANQVNLAVFVGARYRGAAGALAAVSGLMAGPFVVALLLGLSYAHWSGSLVVRHALSGMSCAAAGLTLSVALRQGVTALKAPVPIAFALATFVMSAFLRVPLWLTVVVLAPLSFAWMRRLQQSPTTAP